MGEHSDETENEATAALRKELLEFGMSEKAADKMLSDSDAEKVGEALKVSREFKKSLKNKGEEIQRPDRTVQAALNQGWKSKETINREEREREREKQQQRLEEQKGYEKLQVEIRKKKADEIQRQLKELEEEDAEEQRKREENREKYKNHQDKLSFIISHLPEKDYNALGDKYQKNIRTKVKEEIIPTAANFQEAITLSVDAMLREVELEKSDIAKAKFFDTLREDGFEV